jgi:restriction system protein
MASLPPVFLHFLWVIPLILLIAYLGSPRFKGAMGEARVRRLLAAMLEKNRYTILNDVIIPSHGGTTRIDHVVISQFGVFVIGTEFRRGWISGTEFQDRWKQHRFNRITRFENPLHQNYLQVQALARLLQLPESRFHSVVVIVGHGGFKKGVSTKVLPAEKLIPYMRKRAEKLLTADQAGEALTKLEQARQRPRPGFFVNPGLLLSFILVIALFAGAWIAFEDELDQWLDTMKKSSELKTSPENFHPDGRRKTEHELWEDSLICAFSADTGRCSCYEPGKEKVDMTPEKCRSLAERGSILKQ